MFKNKWFLNGLGTGLIVGSILLELMHAASGLPKPVKSAKDPSQWDEKTIKDAAVQKGFQVFPKDEKVYTEADFNKNLQEAMAANKSASAAPTTTPVAAAKPSPQSASASITVQIAEGIGSKDIAQLLVDYGVVKDAAAFEKLIRDRGIETRLNRGTFTFAPNEDTESVLDQITLKTK